jgi:hypothetical protein
VEKYGRAGQPTDGNIIRRMLFARWMDTDTHSEYVMLIAFPRQTWVTRTRINVTFYAHYLPCFTLKNVTAALG